MKIEKAIKWMEEAIQETTECFEECSPALQKELVEQKEIFELALTSLRSMQEAGEPFHIDRSKWEACDHCKKACWNCNHNLLCCEGNDKECDDCVNQSKWEFLAYQNYCPKCGRPLTEEAWVELERRVMR